MLAATALMTIFLVWGSLEFQWLALRAQPLHRAALLAGMLAAAAGIYFGVLWAAGVKLRHFVAR